MRSTCILLVLVVLGAMPAAAAAPLQASVTIGMPKTDGSTGEFSAELEGGDALVVGAVDNRDDGRTANVQLRFVYRVPPDTVALDEILARIVLEIRDRDGNRISTLALDPNETNLNPNGPSLVYRATMYRPPRAYKLALRVFGNYE